MAERSNQDWKLIFDYITRHDPPAADILSLMAMFDSRGIPATLLRHDGESMLVFTMSMATLQDLSVAAKAPDEEIYSMDRLVQIAAQEWLELHNKTFRWRREALFTLANVFPSGSYDTWGACEALLPHVQVVLEHELQPHGCAMKRAELLQKLAWFDRSKGNYKRASSKAQEAWEISERLQGKYAPMVLSNMTTVADCLIEQDKLKEAENILQTSRTLQEKLLGSRHPETLRSMGNLGWAWFRQERYNEAESLLRETLTGREQTLGSDHPDTLMSMNNLSVVLVEQRSLDEAEELCAASLKLRLQLRDPDHPDVLESHENFADIFSCRGNYEDAEHHLRLVLRSRRRVLGDGHPSTIGSMHQLAYCIGNQGKRDEAVQLYELALHSGESASGSEYMETFVTRLNLALELEKIGNYEEAAQHLRFMLDSRASFTEASNPRMNELMVRAEEELQFIEILQ